MKARVLGVQKVDYVKKSGEPCKGTTLHVAFKDNNVVGEAVDSLFINDNLGIYAIDGIKPDTLVDLEFNRRGYVADVVVCE